MPIYNVPITIYATAYVRAESEEKALELAKTLSDTNFLSDGTDDRVSDKQFGDPELPDVSISPAMTFADPEGYIEEIE